MLAFIAAAMVTVGACKADREESRPGPGTGSGGVKNPEDTTEVVATNKPLMKDFMGLNGHFFFKPELYNQVVRNVRNYHNLDWDVAKPGDPITLPMCINGVDWKNDLYKFWKQAGFQIDICMQFGAFGPGENFASYWKGKEQWAYDYGKAMSKYFGPSGTEKLATSFEIDNEPGQRVDQTVFRNVFKKMAQGLRDGDAQAKIVTPTIWARTADDYSQDVRAFYGNADVLPLYDVLNVHTYATVPQGQGNPNPWNRTYPEDSTAAYLKVVQEVINWRNTSASGKQVWITEFGYDAPTPAAMAKRVDWWLEMDWQGHTDLQQAQYLVRSFLAFAPMDINRAYLYYFNDEDEAAFHAASGLTRNFVPKMSFYAVKQFYNLLGDFRFARVVKKDAGQTYVYEFRSDAGKKVWVAWSPTGVRSHLKDGYKPRTAKVTLTVPSKPVNVKTMATASAEAAEAEWKQTGDNTIEVTIGESPVYIIL